MAGRQSEPSHVTKCVDDGTSKQAQGSLRSYRAELDQILAPHDASTQVRVLQDALECVHSNNLQAVLQSGRESLRETYANESSAPSDERQCFHCPPQTTQLSRLPCFDRGAQELAALVERFLSEESIVEDAEDVCCAILKHPLSFRSPLIPIFETQQGAKFVDEIFGFTFCFVQTI